jgi:hypothetical protein
VDAAAPVESDATQEVEIVELPAKDDRRCYGVKGLSPSKGGGGKLPPEIVSALPKPSPWQACAEHARKLKPLTRTKLTLRFTIERDGSVRRACIEPSSIGAPELEACVLRAAVRKKFPRPSGGVVDVVYPLLIEPAD